MAKHLSLLLLFFLSFQAAYSQTEVSDTLLTASSGKEMRIKSDKSLISIVVKGLDGNNENFYYETKGTTRDYDNWMTTTTFRDIRDIRIHETDENKLYISFIGPDSNPNLITFSIPDPENRTVSSNIGTSRNNLGITLSNSSKGSWNLICSGFGIGWVTPVNSSPSFGTSMGRSLEFSWNYVLGAQWQYRSHTLSTGIGLCWRNYSLNRDKYYHKEDNGEIIVRPFENFESGRSSRLQTFSLEIPISYQFSFGKKQRFSFAAGPILNFNTGGHITTKYTIGDDRIKNSTQGINQNPVTVDLMARFSFYGLGIYVRYAPMNVLRKSTGLEFNSLSTGLMFGF